MSRRRPVLTRTTDRLDQCSRCKGPLVWARTWHLDDPLHVSKWMPVDVFTVEDQGDATANVAVSRDGHGSLLARVLPEGEVPTATEMRARVHMATCPARLPAQLVLDLQEEDLPDNVIPLNRKRQK